LRMHGTTNLKFIKCILLFSEADEVVLQIFVVYLSTLRILSCDKMEGRTTLLSFLQNGAMVFLLICDSHILHLLDFIHQKVFWTEHGTLFGNRICFCVQWWTFTLCNGTNPLFVSLHFTMGQKQIWCQKCCFLLRYLGDKWRLVILQARKDSVCSFLLLDIAIDAVLCHTSTQEATVTKLTSTIQFLHYEALDLYLKALIILTSY
jgi:hypothetical protein